jgi:hypothetical protein
MEAIAEQASREQKQRLKRVKAWHNVVGVNFDGWDTCHHGIGSM